jgi:hypothetical protein
MDGSIAEWQLTQVFTIANTCAVLPVTFSGFSAIRSKQQVNVKWQTAMEENTPGLMYSA